MLLLGAVALYAATRTWVSMTVATPGLPSDRVTVAGSEAAPVLVAIALVVAAGGLAVVASGGWVRQLIGLVVAAVSLLAAITAFRVDAAGHPLAIALRASPAYVGTAPESVHHAPWQIATIALFALGSVLGIIVFAGSRSWPRMGRRYGSPADARGPGPAAEPEATDLWKAFDEGEDPSE